MIPIKLTIEGLYSYKERQTIDFTKLVSNHLFGIFGPVGSGKSSILEAIMLAVYLSAERLNRNDNRYYNLLNLQADRLFIAYECFAGKANSEKFKFLFEARRNGKQFSDVNPKQRVVAKYVNGAWQEIENPSPEEIIGMPLEHFRQTVIIPQGKFREFIELPSSRRTEMLQTLFKLHRFDLADKVKVLNLSNDQLLAKLAGQLLELAPYHPEKEAAYLQQLTELRRQAEILEKQQAKLLKSLQNLREKYQWAQEKEKAEKELLALRGKAKNMQAREKTAKDYQKAFLAFNELFASLRETEHQLAKADTDLQNLSIEKNKARQSLEKAVEAQDDANKKLADKADMEQKCRDLELLVQAKQLSQQLETAQVQSATAHETLLQLRQQVEKDKQLMAQAQQDLKTNKEKAASIHQLKDLLRWFDRKRELEERLMEDANEVAVGQENELLLTEKIRQMVLEEPALKKLPNEALLPQITTLEEALKIQLEICRKSIQQQEITRKISKMAHALVDGQPCPLCGALEHPEPAKSTQAADEQLKNLQQELNLLEGKDKWLKTTRVSVQKMMAEMEANAAALAKAKAKKDQAMVQLSSHLEAFKADNFSPDDPEKVKNAALEAERHTKMAEQLEKTAEKLAIELEKLQDKLQSQTQICNQLDLTAAKTEAGIDGLKKGVLLLKDRLEDYLQRPEAMLKENLAKGRQIVASLEETAKDAAQNLENARAAFNQLDGQLQRVQAHFRDLKEKALAEGHKIDQALQATSFQGRQEVKDLLAKKIDLETEQREINAYKEQLSLVEDRITQLTLKLGEMPFDLKHLREAEEQVALAEKKQKETIEQVAVAENELATTREKLKQKTVLEIQQNQLEIRKLHLSQLQKLFKGKKFVDFVAQIYLQNLVRVANARFMQLTNNNLSLELDEKGEFIVRDHLNSGRVRLLKTLSGGQTFQAALCLALALAENVGHQQAAKQSFFFLDEGFGTLDRQALRTVFHTLRSLQKENRIVGIISHVEELQQEIEVAIQVENHPERGSLLSYSWEKPLPALNG